MVLSLYLANTYKVFRLSQALLDHLKNSNPFSPLNTALKYMLSHGRLSICPGLIPCRKEDSDLDCLAPEFMG